MGVLTLEGTVAIIKVQNIIQKQSSISVLSFILGNLVSYFIIKYMVV